LIYFGDMSRRTTFAVIKRALAETMCRASDMRDVSGTAAIEFAFIAPALLAMMVGMFVFGVAIHDYLVVTNAAEAGAFQLAISRGDGTPWTDTVNAIYGAAPSLNTGNLTVTVSVNGTTCASDSTCVTALNSASGQQAQVTVSYPCTLNVLQINYFPNCKLIANPKERIQ
jgi:Flp pilus assembly protein TadG